MSVYKPLAHDNDRYTLADKEILCELPMEDAAKLLGLGVVPLSLRKKQRTLAKQLTYAYQEGDETHTRDTVKADHYREIAFNNKAQQSLLHTKNVYFAFGTYTSVRLFIIRLNLLLKSLNHSFLKDIFAIAGFSYGLEFLFDCGVVLYTTFRKPLSPMEASLSHWQRFKNVLQKDARISRMANAGIWFVINVLAFVLTGGMSLWLNVGGFLFDICHEVVKAYKILHFHKQLAAKVNDDLAAKIEELNALNKQALSPELEKQKVLLASEIQDLRIQQISLQKKIRSLTLTKIYDVVTTLIIVVGMVLIFFPPTTAAGLVVVGSGITFAAGSIFNGLGRTLANYISNLFQRSKKAEEPAYAKLINANDDNGDVSNDSGFPPPAPKYQHSYLAGCKSLLNSDEPQKAAAHEQILKKQKTASHYRITSKEKQSAPHASTNDSSPEHLSKFSVLSKRKSASYSPPCEPKRPLRARSVS